MNAAEFKKEVNSYIDEAFSKSREYQNVVLDIYDEFRRVCIKNGIRYYVAYGTLLGAVRDGCFLPWDCDFDVQLPIIYRDKLQKALENDLGGDYFYECHEKTDRYPLSLLRVCRKGYDSAEFHVDVFYLIGAPDDEKERIRMRKKISSLFKERMYKYRDLTDIKAQSKLMYLFKKIQNCIYGFCPKRILDRRLDRLCYRYEYGKTEYGMIISEGAGVYPMDLFSGTHEEEIDGHVFVIPDRYDELLSMIYGDYHRYMAIESRFDEFYNGYRRLRASEEKNQ